MTTTCILHNTAGPNKEGQKGTKQTWWTSGQQKSYARRQTYRANEVLKQFFLFLTANLRHAKNTKQKSGKEFIKNLKINTGRTPME